MTSPVSVSIIISTCYREKMFLDCVSSIMCQDYPAFEIIVIDQAEESKLKDSLDKLHPGDTRIRYVRELRAGLARSRNLGVSLAQGAVVAFIDDDAVASATWLQGVSAAFSQVPQPALMAGRLLPIWETEKPDWYPPEREFLLGLYDLGTERRELPEGHMPIGANMAGLKDLIVRYGGFEESLGFNHFSKRKMVGGEDSILGRRIRAAGHLATYEPMATVHHRISRYKLKRRYFLKRHFWEGVAMIEQMRLMDQIGDGRAGIYRFHTREAYMAAARFLLPRFNNNYPQSDEVIRMTALSRLAYSSGIMYGVYSLKAPKETATTKCESA
jgi:glucosyl-dolichyl phosphate glucuronosyltransferase